MEVYKEKERILDNYMNYMNYMEIYEHEIIQETGLKGL